MEAEEAAKKLAGKEHWALNQKSQVLALTPLLTSCVTLGGVLSLPEPLCLHLHKDLTVPALAASLSYEG